jgi:hypothetical protein
VQGTPGSVDRSTEYSLASFPSHAGSMEVRPSQPLTASSDQPAMVTSAELKQDASAARYASTVSGEPVGHVADGPVDAAHDGDAEFAGDADAPADGTGDAPDGTASLESADGNGDAVAPVHAAASVATSPTTRHLERITIESPWTPAARVVQPSRVSG